jgi:hypothetical protein
MHLQRGAMCWSATPDSILSPLVLEWAHHDEIKDQAVMLQGGAPDPEKIHGIHYWRHESPWLVLQPPANPPTLPADASALLALN